MPEALKVLSVHDQYQQPGGEDAVVYAEAELLRLFGHRVIEYRRHNDEISRPGLWHKATLAPRAVWAWDSYREMEALLRRERPDLAHFHNTFPLVSPATYYACAKMGIPVVQTLHNYRLGCPAAVFFRDGHVCEECVQSGLWRGVAHGCYHNSRLETLSVAIMTSAHRLAGTWVRKVNGFIALTGFCREKFLEMGLPAEKIFVKPHFLTADPRERVGAGDYALYIGRLSREKGLRTLLTAWKRLNRSIPLRIIGDGPLRAELEERTQAEGLSNVLFQGRLEKVRVLAALKRARFLIFPSECYETFGMSIIEAFACGVPVIASRLGAMGEIVENGRTGLHFTAGDPVDLAAKVDWAWDRPQETTRMGRAARGDYLARYTAERNHEMLMGIYRQAMGLHPAQARPDPELSRPDVVLPSVKN